MIYSFVYKSSACSFKIINAKAVHETHKLSFISLGVDDSVDFLIAAKDMRMNIASIAFHQTGVSVQQVVEHDFAINKKGVAAQCAKQRALAPAPIKSVWIDFIIITINATGLQI
jgi:hypothetical protein